MIRKKGRLLESLPDKDFKEALIKMGLDSAFLNP